MSLRWNDVVGEGSYLVERSLDGVNWTWVTLLHADTTSYTNTGLQSNQGYFFRVTGLAVGSQVPGDRGDSIFARTQ